MSADARVARAIQEVRRIEGLWRLDPHRMPPPWPEYMTAVDDLIDEAKDALHLTDDDINRY